MAAVKTPAAAIVALHLLTATALADRGWHGRPEPPPWSIGMRLGLNRSTVWRSEAYGDAVAKYGVNGGLAWFIRLGPNVAFQPEAAFSRKGVRTEESSTDYSDRVSSSGAVSKSISPPGRSSRIFATGTARVMCWWGTRAGSVSATA
jgi:hypothetical protein